MSGTTTWPFGCPTGWQETAVAAKVRSEVEQGQPKQRPRFTRTWRVMTAQWTITDRKAATYSAVHSFLDTTLAGATLQFDMAHPVSGATIRVRFTGFPQISVAPGSPILTIAGELEEVFT